MLRAAASGSAKVFVLTYGTLVCDLLLSGLVAMMVLGFITVPIAGALSDASAAGRSTLACLAVPVFGPQTRGRVCRSFWQSSNKIARCWTGLLL
jgi:hypothetical protein